MPYEQGSLHTLLWMVRLCSCLELNTVNQKKLLCPFGSSSSHAIFIVLRTLDLHSLFEMNKPTHDYWGFGLWPSSGIIREHKRTKRFRNWMYFHPQVCHVWPLLFNVTSYMVPETGYKFPNQCLGSWCFVGPYSFSSKDCGWAIHTAQ
jgi:hypothetical protein